MDENLDKLNTNDLIQKIFLLQQERVVIYKDFSNVFKDHVNYNSSNSGESINFIQFRYLCKQISEKFNKISLTIIKIKEILLNERNNNVLFNLIENLQHYEENKFKLVSEYRHYVNKV